MHTSGDSLVAMLKELGALSDPAVSGRAADLTGRLAAGDLRVALVGEAKRGKSSFGNALLGEAVLPTGVIPVTSISTEVRAGRLAVRRSASVTAPRTQPTSTAWRSSSPNG